MKRYMVFLLAGIMCIGVLAGCGLKKPEHIAKSEDVKTVSELQETAEDIAGSIKDMASSESTEETASESRVVDEDYIREIALTNAEMMRNAKSYECEIDINMDAAVDTKKYMSQSEEYSEEEMSMIAGILGNLSVKLSSISDLQYVKESEEKQTAYVKSSSTMSMYGQTENSEVEAYTVLEDGKATTYTKSDDEEWEKSETRNVPESNAGDLLEKIGDGSVPINNIEEKENEYEIKATLTGETIKDAIANSATSMNMDDEQINWDEMSADIIISFDKETEKIKEYSVDCKSLFASIMPAMAEEGMEDALNINDFTVAMKFTGFDNIDKIEIPAEALNAEYDDEAAKDASIFSELEDVADDDTLENAGIDDDMFESSNSDD